MQQRETIRPLQGRRWWAGTQWLAVLSVVVLTCAIGQRFYNAPHLDIGKAAPQTILAPIAVTVEDTKATEEKRKAVRKDSLSVLMIDTRVNEQVTDALQRQLEQGSEMRRTAGAFPYAKTSVLSNQVQAYLRKATDAEWQAILTSANSSPPQAGKAAGQAVSLSGLAQQAVKELQAARKPAPAYAALIQDIIHAREAYSAALSFLPQPLTPNAKPSYDITLLELSEGEWQQVQTRTPLIAARMLGQGIASGLPQSLLQAAIQLQVKDELSPAAATIASQLLLDVLQPNLVRDEAQSRALAERAAQDIKPELVTVHPGEIIVHAGEEITSADFAVLDALGLSRRGTDWYGLIGFGTLVSAGIAGFCLVERRMHQTLRRRDRLLIVLLSLTTPLLMLLHVPSTDLPAIGLLVSTIYGSPLGVTVVGVLSLLLPIGMSINVSQLISSAVAGLVCGGLAGRLRSREELAILGTGVGVLQGALYLLLTLVAGGSLSLATLGAAGIQALLGLAWCIVAIGITPYLEQLFDLVTTIRLVELANPNRPLLKRLAAEAPGTFQHTLFVATLAEAAARALGCNVELVRTGTLYHDVGKMHDPLGFIENQMGGPNKHDLIDDPWKSADIIKKHVTEGLVMARKSRLPKAVQAFIPEHQGTMLIAYFYHQAQQAQKSGVPQAGGVPQVVNESDFRYDGPIPQSRETGIVMLADSCEAALRSLKDATPEEALAMINKILRARWQDDQLVESSLSREDLTKIARIFVEVWQQFNHQRIAYPKLSSSPQPAIVKAGER